MRASHPSNSGLVSPTRPAHLPAAVTPRRAINSPDSQCLVCKIHLRARLKAAGLHKNCEAFFQLSDPRVYADTAFDFELEQGAVSCAETGYKGIMSDHFFSVLQREKSFEKESFSGPRIQKYRGRLPASKPMVSDGLLVCLLVKPH